MVDAGNSLGTAQGRIIIDVSNVTQAAQLIKQATSQINADFASINQSARVAAQGIGQVAAASRQVNQAAARSSSSVASSTRQAAQAAKQTSQQVGVSVQKMLDDVRRYDQAMTRVERRRGVRTTDQELFKGGAVKIDTSQIKKAEEQVTTSMRNMQRSAESFGKSLQRLAGNIFPFSVAAGILTVIGIKTSNTIEQMNIRFRALEGSSEAAEARIAGLTQEARRFNLPLTQVLAGIARLQTLLKQTGNETNRFVGLVARLASVNPVQGAEGAAIAIGEALSGTGNDFYSLQERFNIPRNLIRAAIAETDNFADALDRVLNQLGVTEQVAMEFGQTFQGTWAAAQDAVSRLLGEGLTPILKAFTPIVQKVADIAAELNRVNSPIPTIISGILAMTAAAAPLLFAVGKLAELWEKVSNNTRAASLAQRGMRLAGAGLAAAAGFEIGQRLYGAATGESRESIENRLGEFFAQSAAIIIAGIEQILTAIVAPFQELGNIVSLLSSHLRYFIAAVQKGAADLQLIGNTDPESRARLEAQGMQASEAMLREFLSQGFGTQIQALAGRVLIGTPTASANNTQLAVGQALMGNFKELGDIMGLTATDVATTRAAFLRLVNDGVDPYIALGKTLDSLDLPKNFRDIANGIQMPNFNQRVLDFYNNITGKGGSEQATSGVTDNSTSRFGFTSEQIDAYAKFKQEMLDLETEYNDNILRENEQYQTRRTDIILEYNEKVVTLQEEEFRRRSEAEADLAREIADIQEESAKEQAKAKRDLEAEIAKILRESRIRVLEAAAQLDARAVFEEQRRTKARIGELNTEFDDEQAERKKQADERVKDLQDEFKREEDKRAQDFQRRMGELDRQKNRELQQLYQKHNDTLRELYNQYTRERNQRNQQFVTELNDLAGHQGRMLTTHRLGQFQIEYELLAWYNRMKSEMSGGSVYTPPIQNLYPLPGKPAPTPYQTGTNWVPATSIYKLHEGEGVMTPTVNAIARQMLGGNYSQSQLAGLMTGGRGSSTQQSWDFSGMQVVLGDVGNRSDQQVASMIEEGLYQFFTRASQQTKAAVA